ncbi:MAG: hypothetical protein WC459_04080 [Patescibacteria group bacterium]
MWHVWCHTGAIEVLEKREFIKFLEENPNGAYCINFANGSAARINPGDRLWQLMEEILKNFSIEVFPLSIKANFTPWNAQPNDIRSFDAFSIKQKTNGSSSSDILNQKINL